MANFRAQVIFRVPFGNPFPTLKMIDLIVILMLDVPTSVLKTSQTIWKFSQICPHVRTFI